MPEDQPDRMQALLNDDSVVITFTSADARVRGCGPSLAASDEQLIDLARRTTGKGERDV